MPEPDVVNVSHLERRRRVARRIPIRGCQTVVEAPQPVAESHVDDGVRIGFAQLQCCGDLVGLDLWNCDGGHHYQPGLRVCPFRVVQVFLADQRGLIGDRDAAVPVTAQDRRQHPRLLGHRAIVQREAPLPQRSLRSRKNDVRDLGYAIGVFAQRHGVVGHVGTEDHQASLGDQFVVSVLHSLIGAVGQTDYVALHQFDWTVEHASGHSLIEHQSDGIDRVVIGLGSGRIVIEQTDFQRCHRTECANLVVCHTSNVHDEGCHDRGARTCRDCSSHTPPSRLTRASAQLEFPRRRCAGSRRTTKISVLAGFSRQLRDPVRPETVVCN